MQLNKKMKNTRKENSKGISHVGDCETDGDCRYIAKTNSELKTKCDKSQTGTSYSTRGPDFQASTSANPYESKTLYKCGCQDNYVQKSDNWRQEGCGKYANFSKHISLFFGKTNQLIKSISVAAKIPWQ